MPFLQGGGELRKGVECDNSCHDAVMSCSWETEVMYPLSPWHAVSQPDCSSMVLDFNSGVTSSSGEDLCMSLSLLWVSHPPHTGAKDGFAPTASMFFEDGKSMWALICCIFSSARRIWSFQFTITDFFVCVTFNPQLWNISGCWPLWTALQCHVVELSLHGWLGLRLGS